MSPDCRWQVVGPLSLWNWVHQLFIMNFFIYIQLILFLWKSWLTQSFIVIWLWLCDFGTTRYLVPSGHLSSTSSISPSTEVNRSNQNDSSVSLFTFQDGLLFFTTFKILSFLISLQLSLSYQKRTAFHFCLWKKQKNTFLPKIIYFLFHSQGLFEILYIALS